MNMPEKCPKCGCSQFVDITLWREFVCFTLIAKDETLYEGNQCLRIQRDQLAERVKLIEIERDELKVKASFDELALQKMEERVKQLQEVADIMANAYEEILWDNHDATILENYRKVRSGEGKP